MRSLTQDAELTELLERAVAEHHPRLVLLCSFQKEESVLVDELVRIAPDVRIATIDTGVLFAETLATWRAFEERFAVDVNVHQAYGQWSGPQECCGAAKVTALEAALDGVDGWITGIRREQGGARSGAQTREHDDRRGIWKYNPLAHWSEADVWRRIAGRDLPYNPLHDDGYESIGCAPCTDRGSGRDGRWAGSEKTECGLHV